MGFFKKIARPISKPFKKIGKALKKATREINRAAFDISVGAVLKISAGAFDFLGKNIGGSLGKKFDAIGSGLNTFRSSTKSNLLGMSDILTGHIKSGLKSTLSLASSSLLALGTAISFASGNVVTGSALLMQLDAHFMNGELLLNDSTLLIAGLGDSLGFKNAKEEIENIRFGLVFTSGVIGAFGSVDLLPSSTLSSIYKSTSTLFGAYEGYEQYKYYQNLKDELDKELKRLQDELDEAFMIYERLKNRQINEYLSFDIYSNFAGGKNYNNALVGNANFCPFEISEPYKKVLFQESENILPDMKEAVNFNKKPFSEYYEKILYENTGILPLKLAI